MLKVLAFIYLDISTSPSIFLIYPYVRSLLEMMDDPLSCMGVISLNLVNTKKAKKLHK